MPLKTWSSYFSLAGSVGSWRKWSGRARPCCWDLFSARWPRTGFSYPPIIMVWHGLHRPGVIAIFALTLFGIFYPMIKSRREEQREAAAQAKPKIRSVEDTAPPAYELRLWALGLSSLSIVLLALGALAEPQLRLSRRPVSLGYWNPDADCWRLAQLARDLYGKTKKKAAGLAESVEIQVDIAPEVVRQRTINDPLMDRRFLHGDLAARIFLCRAVDDLSLSQICWQRESGR